MIFGLVLSVVLTGALATYLANYIQRHLWIAYIGLGFILLVAIQLIIGGLVDLEILKINEEFKKYEYELDEQFLNEQADFFELTYNRSQ